MAVVVAAAAAVVVVVVVVVVVIVVVVVAVAGEVVVQSTLGSKTSPKHWRRRRRAYFANASVYVSCLSTSIYRLCETLLPRPLCNLRLRCLRQNRVFFLIIKF